jgi:hypothetical protein
LYFRRLRYGAEGARGCAFEIFGFALVVGVAHENSSASFFEKKEAKKRLLLGAVAMARNRFAFADAGRKAWMPVFAGMTAKWSRVRPASKVWRSKSFLVLFFKKELLPYAFFAINPVEISSLKQR